MAAGGRAERDSPQQRGLWSHRTFLKHYPKSENRSMNIIIPMAGMGKRMRPHTLTTPKPLIAIAGKPMVQRIVEDIMSTAGESVNEIVFIINPAFGPEVEKNLV